MTATKKKYYFVLKKIQYFFEKPLVYKWGFGYNNNRCDMIALKREVAAGICRFSVERMSSYKTGDKSLYTRK